MRVDYSYSTSILYLNTQIERQTGRLRLGTAVRYQADEGDNVTEVGWKRLCKSTIIEYTCLLIQTYTAEHGVPLCESQSIYTENPLEQIKNRSG